MGTYTKIAKYWDLIQSQIVNYEVMAQKLDMIFRQKGYKRILELGCGTGILLSQLAEKGYECTGIDLDESMLYIARSKAKDKNLMIEYLQGDMREIEIDGQFDVVICFQAMSFMQTDTDFIKVINSISRVIVPSGLFSFGVMNIDHKLDSGETASAAMMDLAIEGENYKLVRINSMHRQGEFEQWTAVYFIEEKGLISIDIMKSNLRYYQRENVSNILLTSGYESINVEYKRAANMEDGNMLFSCIRKNN